MRLRSLLFVPGDSERKFARARECGADALILDLEDSVAVSEKATARAHVAGLLVPEARSWTCMVRVNALDTGLTLEDLAAVVKPGLDALLIPKVDGAADLDRIGHYLDALEAKAGMAPGSVKLASVATETPKAMFALGSYAPAHSRLIALTWGAEDLSAELGATDNKEPDGSWTAPYEFARTHACSPPRPPRSRPSTRCIRIFAIPRASSGIAGAPGATVLSDGLRSIPIRLPPINRAYAPPKPRSRMRARLSPRSTPIPAPARWVSRARWSTFPT